MAQAVHSIAQRRRVPVGLVLEGGYNVDALARSLALSLSELAGVPTGEVASESIDPAAAQIAAPVLARSVFSA